MKPEHFWRCYIPCSSCGVTDCAWLDTKNTLYKCLKCNFVSDANTDDLYTEKDYDKDFLNE